MKPALVDTDILSEFLRGTPQVVKHVESYITYYGLELMNWLK